MLRFISFILPAHNEAEHIGAALDALTRVAAALPPGIGHEIIVACDACTDATASIARAGGAQAIEFDKRHIAASRNHGAAEASRALPPDQHLYLFVDADTHANARSVSEAIDAVASGRAIAGGAPVAFDGEIPRWSRITLPAFNTLFRWFRLTGGCFFFVRRDHFDAVAGWDESVFAGEEINLARALKRRGRFHIVRTPVLTSGRKLRTHTTGELLSLIWHNALSGGKMLRDRDRLTLWYGPRRTDPAPTPPPSAPAPAEPAPVSPRSRT
ncbi:MAG: glycosyltransferase [Phycisphaerales bacterium]